MADRQDPTPAQRVLTGITTTGIPHLGNYVGALRPAIAASVAPGVESFLFLADYHGLIKCDDPARIAASRLEVATAWLAAGLDPERTHFYRQSDVPETLELQWLLTCVTSKGLMNRAHAYKAAVDANGPGEDPDAGISLGLFSYPVLMAADILLFNAHKVPVGRDQVQHIEMARDIAQRFNLLFGRGRELLVLPEAVVGEQPLLPGLDGRKMSKSYDNTVPLFSGGRKALEAAVARIVTDSRLPGEPKDPDSSSLLTLYAAFAPEDETAAFRAELEAGLGWGDAKQRLVRCIEREIAPKRERYDALMAAPQQVEDILQAGAAKARRLAQPLMAELRDAVGLTRFAAVGGAAGHPAGPSGGKGKARPPALRQYRDAEGAMRFKLALKNGTVLVEGGPFDSGEAAGRCVQALREAGGDPSRLPAGVRRGAGVEDEALAAGLRAWIDATS